MSQECKHQTDCICPKCSDQDCRQESCEGCGGEPSKIIGACSGYKKGRK